MLTRKFCRLSSPVLLGLLLLTSSNLVGGCSAGTSSSDDVPRARVRVANAALLGGQAEVKIDSNSAGTAGFLQTTSYSAQQHDTAVYVTYTLSSVDSDDDEDSDPDTFAHGSVTLAADTDYTMLVLGRGDVTEGSDSRYPRMRVLRDDDTVPSSGMARLRVIHAAPDAANIDLKLDGTVVAGNVAYANTRQYQEVSASDIAVTVRATAAGTDTPIIDPVTVTLEEGHRYSLMLTEETPPPSVRYGVLLLDDTTASGK